MGFDPLKMGRLEIENHGKQFTLSRDAAGKWQVTDAGEISPANGQAVQTFLDELANLKGDKIVQDPITDPQRFGMDKPTEQILVFGKDDKQIGTIKLARSTSRSGAGDAYARQRFGRVKPEGRADRDANRKLRDLERRYAAYSLREPDFSQFDIGWMSSR